MFRTRPADRDSDTVARQVHAAGQLWAMLDRRLADRDYVAGEALTMGDIPIGAYAWRWFSVAADRPELDNLAAWYERLKARAAYREHVMVPMAS